jgi:hypothetical protein
MMATLQNIPPSFQVTIEPDDEPARAFQLAEEAIVPLLRAQTWVVEGGYWNSAREIAGALRATIEANRYEIQSNDDRRVARALAAVAKILGDVTPLAAKAGADDILVTTLVHLVLYVDDRSVPFVIREWLRRYAAETLDAAVGEGRLSMSAAGVAVTLARRVEL